MVRTKRVPVVLQMSAADCGAACLSMILGYWGGQIALETCRAAMGSGQHGATALMIANAARTMGLEVTAFRHTPQGLAGVSLPAVLHWQGVHFVVLETYGQQEVTIIDPAVGRRTLTPAEFSAGYSGVTLTFTPGPDFAGLMAAQAATATPPSWRGYVGRVLAVPGSKALFIWLCLASIILQLAGLILPVATWLVVEQILPNLSNLPLTLIAIGIILAVVAQAGLSYGRDLLVIRLQQHLDSVLTPDFFRHLLRLPATFVQQRTTGDLISRLEGNATIRELITSGVITGLLDGGLSLLYLFILYAQSPIFGLAVTGAALGHFLLLAYTGGRVHELTQMELATQAEEQSLAVQIVRGSESIKAAGAEEWILSEWEKRFRSTLRASAVRGRYVALINSAFLLLSLGIPLMLLGIGAGAVQSGQLSLGQMLGLVVLASACLTPVNNLADQIHRTQQIWAYLERLGDVLDAAPEEATPLAGQIQLHGAIQVENLSFSYAGDGLFELKELSFAIAPGEKIAIVGSTGAGKSTLVRVLLGLYQPQQGLVRYDGRPLSELGLTRLRREIGVVLQDSFLLSGTIRENIALQQPAMPMSQVIEAAKLAAIHDEIERLPMKYETHVGEGGSGLSGGQRQRIALARALATKPAILILDEATSHLDAVTEQRIQDNLEPLPITRLIIAHRLSSVRSADRILVLDAGRIAEMGAHDSLMAQGGVYRRLWAAAEPNACDKAYTPDESSS